MMLKYTVGWAFAFAVEAQLAELKRDRPELCDGGSDADGNHHQGGAADCFRLDLAAAAALTALSGLVLLVAKPLAYDIECGDHTRRKSRPAPHMARLFSGQRRASRAVEPLPAAPACGGVASTHMGLICGSLTFPTRPGDHWLHDFFEELLADLWAMVARALSVSVMVLWYDTS